MITLKVNTLILSPEVLIDMPRGNSYVKAAKYEDCGPELFNPDQGSSFCWVSGIFSWPMKPKKVKAQ
jgi:hypothetical protein